MRINKTIGNWLSVKLRRCFPSFAPDELFNIGYIWTSDDMVSVVMDEQRSEFVKQAEQAMTLLILK